jgi:hypothetical protein
MKRFDIVVANFKKIEYFYENFSKIRHFDPQNDRIIVLDCSPTRGEQLSKLAKFCQTAGLTKSLLFIARKNWLFNHGAQLDYINYLNSLVIERPQLCYFMQEHYLDTERDVKGDTLPRGKVLDLDEVFGLQNRNSNKLVIFCARAGYRVTQFVAQDQISRVYEHYRVLSAGSPSTFGFSIMSDFSICVDGGNFCVDPLTLMNSLKVLKPSWNTGPGTYNHTHVWETLLTFIHQQANCGFYELSRQMLVYDPSELTRNDKLLDTWKPFYAFPVAWALYRPGLCNFSIELCRAQVPGHLMAEIQNAKAAARWERPGQPISL